MSEWSASSGNLGERPDEWSAPAFESPEADTDPRRSKTYPRFDLAQRIEHAVFLVAFVILAVTGLAQKFATSLWGEAIIGLLGGIELARVIHRTAAIIMMTGAIYHIIAVLYRVIVQRVPLSMIPVPEDFLHVLQDIQFYLGRREKRARYGRYSYVEKAEYFAIVWGTVLMAVTGFMMWNPIATARFLPGEAIPAAKAAHGGEALLAVFAIVLWHFYHVHIRHLNRSIFTGWLTREEMEHEHPAELEEIDAGRGHSLPPQETIHQQVTIFRPLAALLVLALGTGLFLFVTFEQTAIRTVPPGESAPAFLPQTPTPAPALPPTPTLSGVQSESWKGSFEGLFRDRCSTCHGVTAVGELSLADYPSALAGGMSGPGIVPGDPAASLVVQVQSQGGHPGQLTDEELAQVVAWIEAGAPER